MSVLDVLAPEVGATGGVAVPVIEVGGVGITTDGVLPPPPPPPPQAVSDEAATSASNHITFRTNFPFLTS